MHNSTFVGIGLMVALAPVPMKIINAGRKLFLERMKKTDVRVGVFTDGGFHFKFSSPVRRIDDLNFCLSLLNEMQ